MTEILTYVRVPYYQVSKSMKKNRSKGRHPQQERKNSTPPKWLPGLGIAVIVGATLWVYLPAMRSGFIWNDDTYVSENLLLRQVDGLGKIWSLRIRSKVDGKRYLGGHTEQYYPLVFSSFWLESRLWTNTNPMGFHVVNVLLHIANALLIWLICRRLGFSWGFLAAAIFALHPVEVESVAWITERKNVLSGLFYLLALLSYLRFDRSKRKLFYWICFGYFVLALLSKTVTCTLPVILLGMLWLRHGRISRKDLLRMIPFFVVGAILGLFTAYYERYSVGAAGMEWDIAFWQRCVIAGKAVFFYISKLLWPTKLTFIYTRWHPPSFSPLELFWPIAVLAVTLALWRWRKTIGRASLIAWACCLVSLFPALGFVDVYPFRYSFVADHFQYLGSMFFIALVVGLAHGLYRRLRDADRALTTIRSAGIGLLLVVLLLLGWRSRVQAGIYKNTKSLWEDTLAKNDQAWIAWNNVGRDYTQANQHLRAIKAYKQAISLKPDAALAYKNLAATYKQLRRYDEAIEAYGMAIRIYKAIEDDKKAVHIKRDYALAYCGLGEVYITMAGKHGKAIAAYKQAIRIKDDLAMAYGNLGVAYTQAGQGAEAIKALQEAIRIKPDYASAHFNLSKVYWRVGDRASALKHLDILKRLDKPSADKLGRTINR